MDYTEYGGAPLLGVNGGCIICHGRSNAQGDQERHPRRRDFVENDINVKIREKISDLHRREQAGGLASSDQPAGQRP